MLQDEIVHIDLLALRIADIASTPFTLEVGEIEMPFGNLGARRFPKSNPFLTLPLMHEHLTTLRSSDYQLWLLDSRYTSAGNGVHILDQGLYDLGAKVYTSAGMFDFYAAVTNGMISATSGYYQGGLNSHHGFGKTFRIAMTPAIGLTVGVSYAFGPFMHDAAYYGMTVYPNYDPTEYAQRIVGGDIDFSFEHFSLYGQVIYNVWKFGEIYGSDLQATGYSIEGSYTIAPRFSVAARAGGLLFNSVNATAIQNNYASGLYEVNWDNDVFRLEGALGYRLTREVVFKIVYQWNKTMNVADDPPDNLIGVQTVASF